MLHRLLKPCPRCRGNHLLELKEENRQIIKCMQCGYFLLRSEMRFLLEDTRPEHTRDGITAAV
jgi:Zn ribbon nucleic-acid-binding protein